MTMNGIDKSVRRRTTEEMVNAATHAVGLLLALAVAATIVPPSVSHDRRAVFGLSVFAAGMLFMFASSTLYHWWLPGRGKHSWRVCDHTSIYVMIAASYTPVCVGVVGGLHGWLVLGALWAITLAGVVYKIVGMGRWPRFSLAVYLTMGWSVVFIAVPVYERLSAPTLALIAAEGVAYTVGTWFFAHDDRRFYHGIWHLFVLAGATFHWLALRSMLAAGFPFSD